jgi:DNA-binding SARP family transcriptional activator
VGLTGPGALAVGRGLLVTALLAAHHQTAPSLITTPKALTKLLGPTADTLDQRLPQLTVVDNADDAAAATHPTAGGGTHPVLVLLADDDGAVDRLADVMTAQAGTVIVLGQWPHRPTWQADPTGHLHDPHRPTWPGPRLCVLDQVAASDLLTVIAYTRATPPDPPAPSPSAHTETPGWRPPRQPTRHDPLPQTSGTRLTLRVMGEPALLINNEPLTIRRSAALQILVFLATHPHGADTPQLTDAIWPGLPRHSLPGRLYTTLSDLRGSIRTACGLDVIDHTDDRYHLNPTLIDVDLWQLHTAVHHAATAVTHTTTAWQAIIDAYPGDLAAGRRWPWLDPLRERTRRHVIDAYVALADTEPDPHRALTLLQAATRIDPYNTDLHTRVTHTLTTLGDHDTATKTRKDYTRRLIEAGLHPTDAPTTATTRNDTASPSF